MLRKRSSFTHNAKNTHTHRTHDNNNNNNNASKIGLMVGCQIAEKRMEKKIKMTREWEKIVAVAEIGKGFDIAKTNEMTTHRKHISQCKLIKSDILRLI